MTSIESARLALEDMASSLGLDMKELVLRRDQETSTDDPVAAKSDSIDITPNTLRKLQAGLAQEEPVSREEADKALRMVQAADANELSQVHSGLDPARVAILLGLDE